MAPFVVPLFWRHRHGDPLSIVGEVVTAAETSRGLDITGRFDMDTERGAAAYRAVKGRRIRGLSVGMLPTRRQGQSIIAADLVEVSLVARPSNSRTLVESVRSVDALHTRSATAIAEFQTIAKDTTMPPRPSPASGATSSSPKRAPSSTLPIEHRSLTEAETGRIEAATEAIRRYDEHALEERNRTCRGDWRSDRPGHRDALAFARTSVTVHAVERERHRTLSPRVSASRTSPCSRPARRWRPLTWAPHANTGNGLQAPRSLWRSAGFPRPRRMVCRRRTAVHAARRCGAGRRGHRPRRIRRCESRRCDRWPRGRLVDADC